MSKLIKAISSNGDWKEYEYDERGNEIKYEDSDGNQIEYYYDDNNRLIKEIYSYGKLMSNIEYEYDDHNRLIKESHSNGYWVEYEYDERGNKIKEECLSGNLIKYEYDERGNKIKEVYSNGEWVEYKYDERGNKIKEENSKCIILYNKNGSILSSFSHDVIALNEYDNYNNLILSKTYFYTGTISWIKYEYDERGNKIKEEDSDGNWRLYNYDDSDHQVFVQNLVIMQSINKLLNRN